MNQLGKKLAVAIDTSPFSIAVLDEAVIYAKKINAELKVILVEDINIVNAAKSSLIRPINLFAPTAKTMGQREAENVFTLQRSKAQDTVNYILEHNTIKTTLHISRGKVAEEIIKASEDCTGLIIGWAGWRFAKYYYSTHTLQRRSRFRFPDNRNIHMGSTAKYLLEHYPKNIFVLKGEIFKGAKVMAYYDGSKLSRRMLDVLTEYMFDFKGTLHNSLAVLLTHKSLREEAYISIAKKNSAFTPSFFTLSDNNCEFIEHLIDNTKTDALILNKDCSLLQDGSFYADIDKIQSSVIILR